MDLAVDLGVVAHELRELARAVLDLEERGRGGRRVARWACRATPSGAASLSRQSMWRDRAAATLAVRAVLGHGGMLPWRRLFTDPAFLRRYHEFYRTPYLLGFIHNVEAVSSDPRFVLTTDDSPFSAPAIDWYNRWLALDCRHGRVLIHLFNPMELMVWDPITGDQHRFPLTPQPHEFYSGTVLCAARDCDHLDCHQGPFLVVFVGDTVDNNHSWACVYSSETAEWSAQASIVVDSYVEMTPSLRIKDTLYFNCEHGMRILAYDIARHELSVIDRPLGPDNGILIKSEYGGLGFASIESHRAGADIVSGDDICRKKTIGLLEELGLPKGFLPLEDIQEFGYNRETGFMWLVQKKKNQHTFKKIKQTVSYANEVTTFVEQGKLKKITGVKAKELVIWLSVVEVYVTEASPEKVTFKIGTGLTDTFDAAAFALGENSASPMAAAAPELIDDITGEIILRIPPDEPPHLVRASLVCKPWRRLLTDPAFLRLYRAFHRTPPVLGFLHNRDSYKASSSTPRFVPTTAASPFSPLAIGSPTRWSALDCRHGRVLIRFIDRSQLMVWDPITGDQHRFPLPPHLVGFAECTYTIFISSDVDRELKRPGSKSEKIKATNIISHRQLLWARKKDLLVEVETVRGGGNAATRRQDGSDGARWCQGGRIGDR
uniref:F-box domain-containing protein n=1 Tax=Leersia perrieri TaxID=77586 RepID=A0A0D9WV22_9ORYZ